MPLKWYAELINEKTIYFHKVLKWEDTWEIPYKRLDKNLFKNDNMKIFIDVISRENDRLYGLCFCNDYDMDVIWRIYSPDKECVCIQTTMKKLIMSLDKDNIIYGVTEPVMYHYLEESSNLFDFEYSTDTYLAICYFLFGKRIEFLHEKENRRIKLY